MCVRAQRPDWRSDSFLALPPKIRLEAGRRAGFSSLPEQDARPTGEDAMTFQTIRLSAAEGVATLTLARPERLNAFNAQLHADLRAALDEVEADANVRVVVLTGEGRAFSSGQDLAEELPGLGQGRLDLEQELSRNYNPLVLRLARFPKVTIAAINGPAVGAAMNIALACDIAVAARSAYLQEAFARIALVPDAGGTYLLPRLVGEKRALALMLTADQIDAQEAQRMGLVYRVYDDETFAAQTSELAIRLALGPQHAYRLMKEAVSCSLGNGLEEQLALEARLQGKAGAHPDFVEGICAFRDKRPPRFQG